MTNETIKAIVTAESSISHSCILSEEETRTRKEGNTSALRRETLISYATETDFDDDDEPIEKTVMHSYRMPIVSGNSIRGIGRQLLITDTIDDVLGFDFGEIAAMDLPAMNAKKMAAYTAQLFYKGGITPAGCQMVLSEAGAYDNVMNTLPFLDLLGGVYGNHHFTGSLRVGSFVPVTKETWQVYKDVFPDTEEPSLTLDELNESLQVVRYTRMDTSRNNSEGSGLDDNTKMIFGSEVIPAGTKFFYIASCASQNEGTQLAFRAMHTLLARYGFVGGMVSRGHGRVHFSFLEPEKMQDALPKYHAYLTAHEKEILDALRNFPRSFQFTVSEDKKKGAKK